MLSTKKMKGGIFERLGLVGRCLFNLLLINEISGTQAVKILEICGLGEVVGTTSANMRKVVGTARNTVKAKKDYKNYPFLPVFWMIPNKLVQGEFEKRAEHLKALEKEYGKQTALITRKTPLVGGKPGDSGTGNNDPNPNVILRIQPIEALHQLGFKVKTFSERYFSFKAEHLELGGYKVYHDVLKSIIEYDENAEHDIDVNKLFELFDDLSEFIIELDIEYPEIGIAERYRKYLKSKSEKED